MTRAAAKRLALGIAIWLGIALLLLPALQLTSLNNRGPDLSRLILAFYCLGAMLFILLPWLLTRPVRRLRLELQSAEPSAKIFIAWIDGRAGSTDKSVAVVIVNQFGFEVRHTSNDRFAIPWSCVREVGRGEDVMTVVTDDGSDLLRFVPLENAAVGKLRRREVEVLVKSISTLGNRST